MAERFRDSGRTIYNFGDVFLVRCPQCAACAEVRATPPESVQTVRQARLVCPHCGCNKTMASRAILVGAAVDWYFQLPLWLQTACCSELLWAYNPAHLDYLASYVQADLREESAERSARGLRNSTLVSRLPNWLKSAKNRSEILRGIAKLRATLD